MILDDKLMNCQDKLTAYPPPGESTVVPWRASPFVFCSKIWELLRIASIQTYPYCLDQKIPFLPIETEVSFLRTILWGQLHWQNLLYTGW